MANYFQDPAQSFVPTPVYKPDFSALQNTLVSKQRKYDAGISAVRSIRNSVFNAPVTKAANAEVKNQYLAEAEQKLKHLSEVDLSKESNVQEARNVFGNFFKDSDIQRDMAYTEQTNSEINKFHSFKGEKDSFQYADQRNLADINNGVEKVRGSARGDTSVYNVRGFVPFTDMTKYISKLAADEKFAVETIDDNGMTTQKRTNGAKSIGNWTTFVDAATQGKFNNQFQVEARYAKEEAVKMAKASYSRDYNGAEIDDDEALRNVIRDNYKTQFDNHGKIAEQYQQQSVVDRKILDEWAKDHADDPDFEKTVAQKDAEIKSRIATATQYKNEQKKFDPTDENYEKNMKDFMDNPNGFFYSQIRSNSITNMARAFAANEKVEAPKVNEIYKQAYDQQKDGAANQLAAEKARQGSEQHELSKQGMWNPDGGAAGGSGGSGGSGLNADGSKMSAAQMKAAGFENPLFVGNSHDDVKIVSPKDRYINRSTELLGAAYNPILSPTEVGGILADASNGSISYDEVVTYLSAVNANKKSAQWSPEETAIQNKVNTLFKSNGINVDNDNRYGKGRAILALAGKHLGDATNAEKWGTDRYSKLMGSYQTSQLAMNELATLTNRKNDALKPYAELSDYKNVISKDKDGKTRLVSVEDMAKEFTDFTMMDKGNAAVWDKMGVPGFLQPRDSIKRDNSIKMKILQAYRDNTLTFKPDKLDFRVTLNSGEVYKFDEKTKTEFLNFAKKFGTPKELGEKLNRLDDLSARSIPGLQSKEGQTGQVYQLPFSKETDGNEKGVRVVNQILQTGNTETAMVDGVPAGDKYDDLIKDMKTWGSSTIKSQLEPPTYHTKGTTGKPSIFLKFKPMNEKDEKEIAAKYGLEIEDIRKGLELPMREGVNAPDLQPLLRPGNGFYVFDRINRGESMESDQMHKSMGFEYKITPNDRNNPTSAKVVIKRKVYDATTKSMIDGPPFEKEFNLKDANPDQLMGLVNTSFNEHLNLNRNAYKVTAAASLNKTDLAKKNLATYEKLKQYK